MGVMEQISDGPRKSLKASNCTGYPTFQCLMANEISQPLLASLVVPGPRRRPTKLFFPACIGVSTLAIVLVLSWVVLQFLLVFAPRSVPRISDTTSLLSGLPQNPEKSFRRDPREYILNPRWDKDAAPTLRYYHWTITDGQANPDGNTQLFTHCMIRSIGVHRSDETYGTHKRGVSGSTG